MKLTWPCLALVVVLLASASGASIEPNENSGSSEPQLRDFWSDVKDWLNRRVDNVKNGWDTIKDSYKKTTDRIKNFFQDSGNKIVQGNEGVRKCIETFRKEMNDSIDGNAYETQEQYSNYVNDVIGSAANEGNITEFQKNVTNLSKAPTFQSVGKELRVLIERVSRLSADLVKCTGQAIQDALESKNEQTTMVNAVVTDTVEATTVVPNKEEEAATQSEK